MKVFPVSDIGYNPYTTVLATSGDLLRKNPDMAKNMVAAVREGWRIYLDNAAPTNQQMHALNPTMEAAELCGNRRCAEAPDRIESARGR